MPLGKRGAEATLPAAVSLKGAPGSAPPPQVSTGASHPRSPQRARTAAARGTATRTGTAATGRGSGARQKAQHGAVPGPGPHARRYRCWSRVPAVLLSGPYLVDVPVSAAADALDELEVLLGVTPGQVAHPPAGTAHGAGGSPARPRPRTGEGS